MGVNDSTYLIRTHLGNILNAGDMALGYDLRHTVINEEEIPFFDSMPDVILVKKQFEKPSKPSGKKFRKKKHGNQVPDQLTSEVFSEISESELLDDERQSVDDLLG